MHKNSQSTRYLSADLDLSLCITRSKQIPNSNFPHLHFVNISFLFSNSKILQNSGIHSLV